MNGKQIVITPDKFDVFRRALGHLVNDLVGKPRKTLNCPSQLLLEKVRCKSNDE